MNTKIPFIVAALFVLGACGSEPSTPITATGEKNTQVSTVSDEQAYLDLIDQRDTTGLTRGWSEDELVEFGHLSCEVLDAYAPDYDSAVNDLALEMIAEPGFTERDAETIGFLLGAAARNLCPEHLDGLLETIDTTY